MHKIKKHRYSTYFPTIIWCTMLCLSHKFLLNKLLSTFLKTSLFPISAKGPIICNNCFSKDEKEIDNFLLFQHRAK